MKRLIAGPTVFICDECVSMCVEIIVAADSGYIAEIKQSIAHAKSQREQNMKKIPAPDEFWELMDESHIYDQMAASILQSELDLNSSVYARAYNLVKKSRTASKAAWKMFSEANPETDGKQMSASAGQRCINVAD